MWHNESVKIQERSLSFNETIELQVPLIDDIVDGEGKILSYQDFMNQNVRLQINMLLYIGWCKAIPAKWKRMLSGTERLAMPERVNDSVITLKGKDTPLSRMKARSFYPLLIPYSIPTAQIRWEAKGINFGADWSKVYKLAFNSTASTKLQSLQFKILHIFFQQEDIFAFGKLSMIHFVRVAVR